MTRDLPGDIIHLKRDLKAALERIYILERQHQLYAGWIDKLLEQVGGLEGQVRHLELVCTGLCEAILEEESSEGETVN